VFNGYSPLTPTLYPKGHKSLREREKKYALFAGRISKAYEMT